MKRYDKIEKEVRRECTYLECDMCGAVSSIPECDGFKWAGTGVTYGKVINRWYCDGDNGEDEVDLCYECSEWLIQQIRIRKIRREKARKGSGNKG